MRVVDRVGAAISDEELAASVARLSGAIAKTDVEGFDEEIVEEALNSKLYRPKNSPGVVWVTSSRESARAAAGAIEATEDGLSQILPRAPRCINGSWYPQRWILHAWDLTDKEITALQRILPKIDPSAADLVWVEAFPDKWNKQRWDKPGYYRSKLK